MLYAQFSASGEIQKLSSSLVDGWEVIEADDPRISKYLNQHPEAFRVIQEALQNKDLEMVRIIEDLVQLLTKNGIIRFTDLPLPAQNKLIAKQSLRHQLSNEDHFLHFDDDIPL